MKFNIVGITRKDGQVVPDPDHVVATVTMEKDKQQVDLSVHDSKYEDRLRKLFSRPAHRYPQGSPAVQTAAGQSVDPGLQEVQPWDPEMIKAVSNDLFAMGLRYVITPEKK